MIGKITIIQINIVTQQQKQQNFHQHQQQQQVQPKDFQSLPLNAGQRCSFIIDFSRMSKATITIK